MSSDRMYGPVVGLPCHHPAWPMRCDRCGRRADGFSVRWVDGTTGYGIPGVACRPCNRVVLRRPDGVFPGWLAPTAAAEAVHDSLGIVPDWLRLEDFEARCEGDGPESSNP